MAEEGNEIDLSYEEEAKHDHVDEKKKDKKKDKKRDKEKKEKVECNDVEKLNMKLDKLNVKIEALQLKKADIVKMIEEAQNK
ncbi:hypothetical protein CASFOL_027150 [Castilleja foliolosa]|uniref:Uncharacterized protein n=1 Tax=Castilleja foliolosa TaxID=1961234 RepID=A0ABD3CFJ2_9LAMI